ncbi:MAG: Hsp20 family protein [SAR324 cluster bacterium]|nr:Hsp20 family protein [SAR324 cluster bacterium]
MSSDDSRELKLFQLLERKKNLDARLARYHMQTPEDAPDIEVDSVAVFDMYMIDSFLYLDLEIPGVHEDDIEIILNHPELLITGHFPDAVAVENCVYLQQKRKRGKFSYKFIIPNHLAIHEHESQMAHGIFHLKMRLSEKSQQKQLPSLEQ